MFSSPCRTCCWTRGSVWRKKALTLCVSSVLVVFIYIFVITVKRAVEAAKFSSRARDRKECSLMDNLTLRGPIQADTDNIPVMAQLQEAYSLKVKPGGWYTPLNCRAKHKVAVIVPYRDRRIHLKLFIQHMHPFLQRQHIEYLIVVVEQALGSRFNRALLMNIGFVEVSKRFNVNCFVFHDVDLLPLDDRIMYMCLDQPLHLSMVVDTLGESLMYSTLFGGAVALSPSMIKRVNGFSNLYFGWGGEDDDMSYRLRSQGLYIQRYEKEVARYTMMKHAKEDEQQWDTSRKLEAGRGRIHEEGLNTLEYQLLDFKLLPLYTWIYVDVDENSILRKFGLEKTSKKWDQMQEQIQALNKKSSA